MAIDKVVSIATARSKFTQLVREAETGQEIVVTRDGKPVARILSEEVCRDRERRMAVDELLRLREKWAAKGITGRELFEESRRDLEERP